MKIELSANVNELLYTHLDLIYMSLTNKTGGVDLYSKTNVSNLYQLLHQMTGRPELSLCLSGEGNLSV